MDLNFYKQSIQQHGIRSTLVYSAYRAANRVSQVALWNALTITLDQVDPKILAEARTMPGRLLEPEAMRPFVSDPENHISHEGIDLAQGHHCYALFDGEQLMSYGWYSNKPTRLLELDASLALYFNPSFVYMYNGFTHPKYRGKRLHAIGMAGALERFTLDGFKGLVSYVDTTNFASLKSCERMGYETFGHVAIVKVGSRRVCPATPNCARYDFRIGPA